MREENEGAIYKLASADEATAQVSVNATEIGTDTETTTDSPG